MLNGMLWIVRSGAQWRELPEAYGPWQSVYARFAKWRDDGTLERVFHTLSGDADMENLSVDSTCIKIHESANGGGKTADKAVGRTRGGLNTKIHAVVDGLGNPVGFFLSAGNDHDSVHAVELLKQVKISGSNILADCAYGAQCIYKHKPATFDDANEMSDRFICFYSHERIQLKTGEAPLARRLSV